VLIGFLYNSSLLGLYDRSFRLVIVSLWQLNAPLDRVGTALLSRLRTAEAQFLKAYYLMVQLLLGLTAPGFVWAAMMSGILVPSMLGSAWIGAVPIVTWLSISVIPAPITMSTYWLFVSQGRSRDQFFYGAIRNGLVVISSLAGVHWGPGRCCLRCRFRPTRACCFRMGRHTARRYYLNRLSTCRVSPVARRRSGCSAPACAGE
jgi:PST family polysaccharide transporter